ncbi:MAG: DNA-3-methyladenine glycosylase [Bdellovibrionales bacterium]|nr:DNA-3-methyladenine glycosylase [Ramlibacter sp.]
MPLKRKPPEPPEPPEPAQVQAQHIAGRPLKPGDFIGDSHEIARMLIGATLLVDGVGGIIVETEAYDRDDPASHTFGGLTPRNAAMFGPAGRAYVYRSYGIHWCLNFVCCEEGHGAGVLIRAIEPTKGLDVMRERRGLQDPRLLCSGPGKLGQALAITHAMNGHRLDRAPFKVMAAPEPVEVVTGPRIGISKAVDVAWRFGLAGSRFCSARFAQAAPNKDLPHD